MSIQILGYPLSVASGQKLSHETPAIFKEVFFPRLEDIESVHNEFLMVDVDNSLAVNNGTHKIRNFESVKTSLENLFAAECKTLWEGNKPLVIGGDHSQGFPTIKSVLLIQVLKDLTKDINNQELKELANNGEFIEVAAKIDELVESGLINKEFINNITDKIDVIWLDAHGDFNDINTTSSGNFHGMPLAAVCGEDCEGLENIGGKYFRVTPKNIHVLCARDLDISEENLMKHRGVDFEAYEMSDNSGSVGKSDVGQKKLTSVMSDLITKIKDKGNKIIVSCDVDHIDGDAVPETGTPQGLRDGHANFRATRNGDSPKGPGVGDTCKALANILDDEVVLAADVSEGAPLHRDKEGNLITGITTINTTANCVLSMIGGTNLIREVHQNIRLAGRGEHRASLLTRAQEATETAQLPSR
ncbi:MAG: arginase family protein [Pseudomonadota bacterium]